ncbi:hypothetical protein MHYP_G00061400 [Metynnis hypsauchen]
MTGCLATPPGPSCTGTAH